MRLTFNRLILTGFVVVVAAVPRQSTDLDGLRWLAGEWQRETRSGISVERWEHTDMGLVGEGLALRDGDPLPTESLLLVPMGGDVFYVAKPVQNPYPVAFRLVSRDGGEFVFENTMHDFPQRIIYSRTTDDTMTVAIEGPGEDGETQRIEFRFVRR